MSNIPEGVVVPALRYTVFNYAQLTSATEEVIIADRIPVAPFARIGLNVRTHRKNVASGGSFTFLIRGINPSDEDGQDFVTSAALGTTAAINGTGNAAINTLTTIISDCQYPMIRVVMSVVGSSAAGLLLGVFSADLILRTSG